MSLLDSCPIRGWPTDDNDDDDDDDDDDDNNNDDNGDDDSDDNATDHDEDKKNENVQDKDVGDDDKSLDDSGTRTGEHDEMIGRVMMTDDMRTAIGDEMSVANAEQYGIIPQPDSDDAVRRPEYAPMPDLDLTDGDDNNNGTAEQVCVVSLAPCTFAQN